VRPISHRYIKVCIATSAFHRVDGIVRVPDTRTGIEFESSCATFPTRGWR
jgi:hypothetical protein